MRCYIFIISAFLLLFNLQASPVQHSDELDFLNEYDTKFSISSIWEKVKDSLKKAWNSIKEAAKQTIETLKEWIYNLKLKADEILENVKERLNEIKEELKQRLEDFAQQSQEIAAIVNKCYKEHEEDIENIIKDTVRDIGKCITNYKADLVTLEDSVKNPLNEELFIKDLQIRLDSCVKNEETLDICLLNIEAVVYDEFYLANKEILRNEKDVKNILGDIMDKIMQCASNGVMKATEKLSKKVIDIGQCINKEIKDKNENYVYASIDSRGEDNSMINIKRFTF